MSARARETLEKRSGFTFIYLRTSGIPLGGVLVATLARSQQALETFCYPRWYRSPHRVRGQPPRTNPSWIRPQEEPRTAHAHHLTLRAVISATRYLAGPELIGAGLGRNNFLRTGLRAFRPPVAERPHIRFALSTRYRTPTERPMPSTTLVFRLHACSLVCPDFGAPIQCVSIEFLP